jgi:hypothetical protein
MADRPARSRLKNARSGVSGSSSRLPQLRQTCNSGNHPKAAPPKVQVRDGAPHSTRTLLSLAAGRSDSSTATRREKLSPGSADGNNCSLCEVVQRDTRLIFGNQAELRADQLAGIQIVNSWLSRWK